LRRFRRQHDAISERVERHLRSRAQDGVVVDVCPPGVDQNPGLLTSEHVRVGDEAAAGEADDAAMVLAKDGRLIDRNQRVL
jgi:selenophosphate synthetase-related protein